MVRGERPDVIIGGESTGRGVAQKVILLTGNRSFHARTEGIHGLFWMRRQRLDNRATKSCNHCGVRNGGPAVILFFARDDRVSPFQGPPVIRVPK